jgi:hypothetical protein
VTVTRAAGRKLFEEVAAATGLALVIGPGAVQRALAGVGVTDPELATVEDYRRALPQLKVRMAFYLTPPELERHLEELDALLV